MLGDIKLPFLLSLFLLFLLLKETQGRCSSCPSSACSQTGMLQGWAFFTIKYRLFTYIHACWFQTMRTYWLLYCAGSVTLQDTTGHHIATPTMWQPITQEQVRAPLPINVVDGGVEGGVPDTTPITTKGEFVNLLSPKLCQHDTRHSPLVINMGYGKGGGAPDITSFTMQVEWLPYAYLFPRESNFRYIRDLFAIRENLYTRNICQSRLQYPQQIWHLDIFFTVPLYYGTSASLAPGGPTDTFLVPSSLFLPMSHHSRFGRRTEMSCRSRNGTPARARGLYGRLTAKPRAQIGRYAIDWEQRNCHAGTHL